MAISVGLLGYIGRCRRQTFAALPTVAKLKVAADR
jgi:hypothetical protein